MSMGQKGKGKRRRSEDVRDQPAQEPNHNGTHEHDGDEVVETWALLARTYLKLDRAIADRLASWELTPAQFDVLARLGAEAGISQQQLAERLLVTKGNVSQLLSRLESRGLIYRQRDGRMLRLHLSDEGQRLHEQVMPAYESWIPEHFVALKPGQLRRFQKALRLLDQQLGADAGAEVAAR